VHKELRNRAEADVEPENKTFQKPAIKKRSEKKKMWMTRLSTGGLQVRLSGTGQKR
jgi:hypothetical protein